MNGPSQPCLSVTELTQKIKGVVEPPFADVWVKAEVSNARPAASGHLYFTLKDQGASIAAAAFGWGRSSKSRGFEIKDGLEVICRGKISIYSPRGSYQLICEQIEPVGSGTLQLAFEQLKIRLGAEGLFAPERKRALPKFPTCVLVVTSPSGAALHDILTIMERRSPQVRVIVVPTVVQGIEAPKEIISALRAANEFGKGEVIVLARGGGSIEDLWCFNDETLAREIARSKLPVISAVGHEIDFTISDFVADLRAPTPSAAAEILTASWVQARGELVQWMIRLRDSVRRDLTNRKRFFELLLARLVNPKDKLQEQMQRCDDLLGRLLRATRSILDRRRASLEGLAGRLDALSPLRVLERGYSLTKREDGELVRHAKDLHAGDRLKIAFHDGEVGAQAL